jgi:hypothetical protein
VEPAHLREPARQRGPSSPSQARATPQPARPPTKTSLAGPRSILIAALITISAMRAHSISQSYFIVPRRSLKMLRGSLAPSGYRPQTTSLSRSPTTLAAQRLSSGTPDQRTPELHSDGLFSIINPSSHTQRRKKEKKSSQKKVHPQNTSQQKQVKSILTHTTFLQ